LDEPWTFEMGVGRGMRGAPHVRGQ
jgi:hypothetical protein